MGHKWFLLFTALLFISCASVKEPKQIAEPLDYTDQNIIDSEKKRITEMLQTDSVKALWRSLLLGQQSLTEECQQQVYYQFKDAIEEKDYYLANSYFLTLKNSGWKFSGEEEAKYKDLISKDVPGLSPVPAAKIPKNISDCLNATVTIWVDRGVKIQNGAGFADIVLGSGFFIDKRGYLITNHHVIESMVNPKYEGYSRLYIKLHSDPDTKIPAKVIGYDSILDLALLKVELEPEFILTLGSSKELHVGDKVSAIGTPLGLEGTLTSGIISSTDRKLTTLGNVFQIDAAVNSGNSGGPLIDQNMKVQAVVFAGILQFQGLNFAIPVEYLRQELPVLYNGNEVNHCWIGAFGHTKRTGNKKTGLEVQYVMPGGPAFLSGLKPGDVITKIENFSIKSLEDWQITLMAFQPVTMVKLSYLANGEEEKTVNVYLNKRPDSPALEVYKSDLLSGSFIPLFGMKLVNSNSSYHKEYTVTEIIRGSAADESNFSENDKVIVKGVDFDNERKVILAQVYAKRKKKGYLDITMVLGTTYDSPYYF